MRLLDFLKEKAKFFSPAATIRSASPSSTDVSLVELELLNSNLTWVPEACRHDKQLVDSLLAVLDECLLDAPEVDQRLFDSLFQPAVDLGGRRVGWDRNVKETDVSFFSRLRLVC